MSPLLVIFITAFIDLIGFGIVIPLTPYLSTHFGASPFQVSLLLTVYSLMQFLFSPFWGGLSDRIGRRPVIIGSLFLTGLCYVGFAYATTFEGLLIWRALGGLFAANISTAFAYVADVTDEKNRSKGMGLVGAAFGLGFIVGPVLGGLLGELGKELGSAPPLGMSFPAIGAAAICFANTILALFILKEPKEIKKRERKSRLQLVYQFMQDKKLGRFMIAFFLTGFAMANMEATLFLLLKDRFNWDLRLASFAFAYAGLMIVFTQGYLVRKFIPKYGEKNLIHFGLIFFAIGLFGLGWSSTIPVLAVFVTIMSIGQGLTNPSLLGLISIRSSADHQGGTMGVTQSLSALGRILGPLLGGYLYQSIGFSSPFYVAAGVALLAWILASSSIWQGEPKQARAS